MASSQRASWQDQGQQLRLDRYHHGMGHGGVRGRVPSRRHGSGAQLNPAVTVVWLLLAASLWRPVSIYFIGEFIGAFLGALLVLLSYFWHWAATRDPRLKLAVFSTGPAIRSTIFNLISEIVGTFVLVFGILAIKGASMDVSGAAVPINVGSLGIIPVAFLVWVIGLALGRSDGLCHQPCP